MMRVKLAVSILIALMSATAIFARRPSGPSTEYQIKLPLGVPFDAWNYFVPKDNPMTAEKVELGKDLFFDKTLSADGSVSCSTCHVPERAFTDGKTVAEGIHGRKGTRNAPTLLDAMFDAGQFWDGRAETLESQVAQPLVNPDEMGNGSVQEVVERVSDSAGYRDRFQRVFGGRVSIDGIERAISAYERTLVSGNSPLDRYLSGNRSALNDAARRGMSVFTGKARCTVCHNFNAVFGSNQSFPFLTDQMYHNTGVSVNDPAYASLVQRAVEIAKHGASKKELEQLSRDPQASSLGRFIVTGNVLDVGAFKTPSLRDVELTAPYFHDGSAQTLEDVVKFYVKGGGRNPNIDWELQPIKLSEQEQADLVEFLKSFTSDDTRRLTGKKQ